MNKNPYIGSLITPCTLTHQPHPLFKPHDSPIRIRFSPKIKFYDILKPNHKEFLITSEIPDLPEPHNTPSNYKDWLFSNPDKLAKIYNAVSEVLISLPSQFIEERFKNDFIHFKQDIDRLSKNELQHQTKDTILQDLLSTFAITPIELHSPICFIKKDNWNNEIIELHLPFKGRWGAFYYALKNIPPPILLGNIYNIDNSLKYDPSQNWPSSGFNSWDCEENVLIMSYFIEDRFSIKSDINQINQYLIEINSTIQKIKSNDSIKQIKTLIQKNKADIQTLIKDIGLDNLTLAQSNLKSDVITGYTLSTETKSIQLTIGKHKSKIINLTDPQWRVINQLKQCNTKTSDLLTISITSYKTVQQIFDPNLNGSGKALIVFEQLIIRKEQGLYSLRVF